MNHSGGLDDSRVKVALAATMQAVKAYRSAGRTGCKEADEVRLARPNGVNDADIKENENEQKSSLLYIGEILHNIFNSTAL